MSDSEMDHQLQLNIIEAYGKDSFALTEFFEIFSVLGKIKFSKVVSYEN